MSDVESVNNVNLASESDANRYRQPVWSMARDSGAQERVDPSTNGHDVFDVGGAAARADADPVLSQERRPAADYDEMACAGFDRQLQREADVESMLSQINGCRFRALFSRCGKSTET